MPKIIPALPPEAPPANAGIPQTIATIPRGIPNTSNQIIPQVTDIPASAFAPADGSFANSSVIDRVRLYQGKSGDVYQS